MSDVKEAVKKYWPYALGAVAAIYIISRSSGGGGDAGASYMQQRALDMEASKVNAQIGVAQLDAQTRQYAAAGTTQAQLMQAQAQTAMAVGASASAVVQQLQSPVITALQASAMSDVAALTAAGTASAGAMQSVGMSSLAAGMGVGQIAQGLSGQSQSFSSGIGSSTNSLSNFQGGLNSPIKDTNQSDAAMWSTIGTVALAFSDSRLKKSIIDTPYKSGIFIDKLRFVQYEYLNGQFVPVGLVAQELEEIAPQFVREDEESGMLQIDLAGLLMASLQEIKALRTRVSELEKVPA